MEESHLIDVILSRFEEINNFNEFIDENHLIDLPSIGKRFTRSYERCLSNPCQILLSYEMDDSVPILFKMLKCWGEFSCYHGFLYNHWKNMLFVGWGDFVLKEKLKSIKSSLREWHKNHGSNLSE